MQELIMCVTVLLTQLSPTLHDPTDCSWPGSSVHEILQARKLEWVSSKQPNIYSFKQQT